MFELIDRRRFVVLALGSCLTPSVCWGAGKFDIFDEQLVTIQNNEGLLTGAAHRHEAKDYELLTFGAAPPSTPPSKTIIADRAVSMILTFEVSNKRRYERKLRGAIWPGARSGVTIGIGYDLGYVGPKQLSEDWKDLLPSKMIEGLKIACKVRGRAARRILPKLNKVDVPFDTAEKQFREKLLPRYVTLTERNLPNTSLLSDASLGALVSLTYNRGTSYNSNASRDSKGRYKEMRNIKRHMSNRDFHLIPNEIRNMKRIWNKQKLPGLHKRRDIEAALFEAGLG